MEGSGVLHPEMTVAVHPAAVFIVFVGIPVVLPALSSSRWVGAGQMGLALSYAALMLRSLHCFFTVQLERPHVA